MHHALWPVWPVAISAVVVAGALAGGIYVGLLALAASRPGPNGGPASIDLLDVIKTTITVAGFRWRRPCRRLRLPHGPSGSSPKVSTVSMDEITCARTCVRAPSRQSTKGSAAGDPQLRAERSRSDGNASKGYVTGGAATRINTAPSGVAPSDAAATLRSPTHTTTGEPNF